MSRLCFASGAFILQPVVLTANEYYERRIEPLEAGASGGGSQY